MYSFALVMALACAGFFYQTGRQESDAGVLWCGLSLLISALIIIRLQGGVGAVLLGQLGLLLGITLYRVWRDPH